MLCAGVCGCGWVRVGVPTDGQESRYLSQPSAGPRCRSRCLSTGWGVGAHGKTDAALLLCEPQQGRWVARVRFPSPTGTPYNMPENAPPSVGASAPNHHWPSWPGLAWLFQPEYSVNVMHAPWNCFALQAVWDIADHSNRAKDLGPDSSVVAPQTGPRSFIRLGLGAKAVSDG